MANNNKDISSSAGVGNKDETMEWTPEHGGSLSSTQTEFVEVEEMSDYRNMLDELLDVESGLSDWEINFLDHLYGWDGCFTVRQANRLEKMWERHL